MTREKRTTVIFALLVGALFGGCLLFLMLANIPLR
jgi:hypothetical protein